MKLVSPYSILLTPTVVCEYKGVNRFTIYSSLASRGALILFNVTRCICYIVTYSAAQMGLEECCHYRPCL